MAQIYQADLAQIGFNVTLRPLDNAIFLDIANNFKYQGIRLGTHSLGNLTPASNTTGGTYGPANNFAGFKDDAYTMLVNQVVTETDPVKQQQLYNQLNAYYMDQAWTLHIVQNPEHAVARSNVRGLEYDARPALPLAEVWLA
jgi:ABC-type transport system substrate-binding protein